MTASSQRTFRAVLHTSASECVAQMQINLNGGAEKTLKLAHAAITARSGIVHYAFNRTRLRSLAKSAVAKQRQQDALDASANVNVGGQIRQPAARRTLRALGGVSGRNFLRPPYASAECTLTMYRSKRVVTFKVLNRRAVGRRHH